MVDPTLAKILEAVEEYKGGVLDKFADAPNTAPPAAITGSEAPSRYMTRGDLMQVRSHLHTKSNEELFAIFAEQARRKDVGIPFEMWASAGGNPVMAAIDGSDVLTKALDSAGASALIRQDLEPVLYELFVREFPAWQRFQKEPANGLVHAYNQITAFGDAQFMTELGTVTDDKNTYERKTTNIAVIATRRGVSLKSQFAVLQGGAGFNPESLELQGGLRAIAHKMQKTIFQGNASASGGSSDDEDGAFDANSFDGLRTILKNNDVDTETTGNTPDDLRGKIDDAATQVMDAGGRTSVVYIRAAEKTFFDKQQDKNVRYMDNLVNVAPGVLTNAVNSVFGPLPLVPVPGDSIGVYDNGSSKDCADIYLLDEQTITLPYLGSDSVTTLDIPIGIGGQLTHLFILFGMWGLAVKALPFNMKVRAKIEA